MVRDRAVRLLEHPVGDPADRRRVVLIGERLGEHGERADGCLQLVADVGDEVGADGVDPPALADVLDGRERTALRRGSRGDDRRRSSVGRTAR